MRKLSWLLSVVFLCSFTLLIAGCDPQKSGDLLPDKSQVEQEVKLPDTVVPTTEGNVATAVPVKVTLYFATEDAAKVVPEVRAMAPTDSVARAALEQLIQGTKNPKLVNLFPKGTKVRKITIKDHIAYVDFSEAILKNSSTGSATERLLIASIVNTLTEFKDIYKVQILVEGKKRESLYGHMDLTEPFSRMTNVIKKP